MKNNTHSNKIVHRFISLVLALVLSLSCLICSASTAYAGSKTYYNPNPASYSTNGFYVNIIRAYYNSNELVAECQLVNNTGKTVSDEAIDLSIYNSMQKSNNFLIGWGSFNLHKKVSSGQATTVTLHFDANHHKHNADMDFLLCSSVSALTFTDGTHQTYGKKPSNTQNTSSNSISKNKAMANLDNVDVSSLDMYVNWTFDSGFSQNGKAKSVLYEVGHGNNTIVMGIAVYNGTSNAIKLNHINQTKILNNDGIVAQVDKVDIPFNCTIQPGKYEIIWYAFSPSQCNSSATLLLNNVRMEGGSVNFKTL